MTVPIQPAVQIQREPTVEERIGPAIEPFIQMMRDRRDREQRQQQIMVQLGQLKLAQDKQAEDMKQQSAVKKALLAQVAGATQALQGLNTEQSETEKRLAALAESGDPQVFQQGLVQMGRELVAKQKVNIKQKYEQMAQDRGSPLTKSERAQMFLEFAEADKENAPSWAGAANTLEVSTRPGGGFKIVPQKDPENPADQKVYNFAVYPDGRMLRLGERDDTARQSLAHRIDRWRHGNPTERRSASLAERALQVHEKLTQFENEEPEAAFEALSAIASGKVPFVGKAVQIARAGLLSPRAQIGYALYNDYLEVSLPMMHGLRVTDVQKILSENAHFPPAGAVDPQVLQTVQQNRMRIVEIGLSAGPPGRVPMPVSPTEAPKSGAPKTETLEDMRRRYGLP